MKSLFLSLMTISVSSAAFSKAPEVNFTLECGSPMRYFIFTKPLGINKDTYEVQFNGGEVFLHVYAEDPQIASQKIRLVARESVVKDKIIYHPEDDYYRGEYYRATEVSYSLKQWSSEQYGDQFIFSLYEKGKGSPTQSSCSQKE